jgi:hypothetical protein
MVSILASLAMQGVERRIELLDGLLRALGGEGGQDGEEEGGEELHAEGVGRRLRGGKCLLNRWKRLAVSGWGYIRAKGDRKICCGHMNPANHPVSGFPLDFMISLRVAGGGAFPFSPLFSPPFFQVSGLGHQAPGTGDQVQVRVREICPLSSTQSSPLRVAGGSPGWP